MTNHLLYKKFLLSGNVVKLTMLSEGISLFLRVLAGSVSLHITKYATAKSYYEGLKTIFFYLTTFS